MFVKGDYHRADDLDPRYALRETEFVATLSPVDEFGLNEYFLDDWREAQRDGRARLVGAQPTDPDSLLAGQPHSGTHSIIDVSRGVAVAPTEGAVAPLTEQQLVVYFDTAAPSPDQVDAWVTRGDWYEIRDQWQGGYVISYLGGEPVQIHFFGYSGD